MYRDWVFSTEAYLSGNDITHYGMGDKILADVQCKCLVSKPTDELDISIPRLTIVCLVPNVVALLLLRFKPQDILGVMD